MPLSQLSLFSAPQAKHTCMISPAVLHFISCVSINSFSLAMSCSEKQDASPSAEHACIQSVGPGRLKHILGKQTDLEEL